MLIISKQTPTASRRLFSRAELVLLLTILPNRSISFYVEPEPDDCWRVFVNLDVGHVLDDVIRSIEVKAAP